MTLGEFLNYLNQNPQVIMVYFLAIPILALWTGWMDRDNGLQSPWKYIHGLLAYAACIPGIFSVALSVYMFLFERGSSILNMNILAQVVPVISMVLTLSIIRKNVPWENVPGTGRLSNLMTMITAAFILMYLLHRTHIFAFVAIPVQYLLLIVIGLLLVFRFSYKGFAR